MDLIESKVSISKLAFSSNTVRAQERALPQN